MSPALQAGLALALLAGAPALAHEMRMALIELREVREGVYAVTQKSAADAAPFAGIDVTFPPHCADQAPPRQMKRIDHIAVVRHIVCAAGEPASIAVANPAGRVDVLLSIDDGRGGRIDRVISEPFAEVALGEAHSGVRERFLLGVEHILGGWDHLLFVFGVLLLVRGARAIVATITAFTLAHSLTLALTVLGVAAPPGPPVEAFIALSIVYLAVEVAKAGARGAGATPPWGMAFAFGLVHGFGFAGALKEAGLLPSDVPLTLLLFNVGIEAGQITFAAIAGSLLWAARRSLKAKAARLDLTAAYGMGAVASFWTIERVAAFW